MRPLTILLVLAALTVGVAGCGGGSKSAAETSPTTTTTESMTTEETTEATEMSTTESTSTEAGEFNFASGDCRKLLQSAQELSQSLSSAAMDKEKLTQAKQAFQSFVNKAPSDIKPDLQVLADAFSKYVEVLTKIDIKPGQVPDAATLQKLQRAIASIDEAKVQQASRHLDVWARSHCGTSGG